MKKIFLITAMTILAGALALLAGCSDREDIAVEEIEQLQILDHNLAVHEFTGDSPQSTAVISGTAQNTGDLPIIKAVVTANFYTEDGQLLATESATMDNLAPGVIWAFTIQTSGPDAWKAKRYEVFPDTK